MSSAGNTPKNTRENTKVFSGFTRGFWHFLLADHGTTVTTVTKSNSLGWGEHLNNVEDFSQQSARLLGYLLGPKLTFDNPSTSLAKHFYNFSSSNTFAFGSGEFSPRPCLVSAAIRFLPFAFAVFRTSRVPGACQRGASAGGQLASGAALVYLRYPLQISSAPLYYTQLQGPHSTEALASPQPRPSGRRNGEPPAGEPTKPRVAAAPKCGQCGRRKPRQTGAARPGSYTGVHHSAAGGVGGRQGSGGSAAQGARRRC